MSGAIGATQAKCFKRIRGTYLLNPFRMHPYTTPEIIRVPIETGSEGYLAWINEVTR